MSSLAFVPVVVRKFMQGRHANQYLQPNRLPIAASAEQPGTSSIIIMVIRKKSILYCLAKAVKGQHQILKFYSVQYRTFDGIATSKAD